jgi:hypothetical protein
MMYPGFSFSCKRFFKRRNRGRGRILEFLLSSQAPAMAEAFVNHDYTGEESTELSLVAGETIFNVDMDGGDW